MTPGFADTSFYVALHNRRDGLHGQAVALLAGYKAPVVTTDFILIEVANFFTRPGDRAVFVEFVAGLMTSDQVQVVPASADLFSRGLALFAARPDKEWSLTDCISFVVMTDYGLTDALTADQHFAQAGFRPLLVP